MEMANFYGGSFYHRARRVPMGSSLLFFFPHLGKPSMEHLPLARALAIERPHALGTIFLASLHQAMGKYVTEIPYHRVGGALWFVQIWLFAYFP